MKNKRKQVGYGSVGTKRRFVEEEVVRGHSSNTIAPRSDGDDYLDLERLVIDGQLPDRMAWN